MTKDRLTAEDVESLDRLLHEQGDRTAFHLHYYELTGNEQVLDMAKISQLTGWVGGVAENANDAVQTLYPDKYPDGPADSRESPTGGVKVLSQEVAESVFQRIQEDVSAGGTGVLSERQALDAARDAWDSRGLGDQFPGNLLMKGETWTEGSWIAAKSALEESVVPEIGQDAAFQASVANHSYHVTEDGKVGFYVDRETGLTGPVVDHQDFHIHSKAEWATGIETNPLPTPESRGVLSALSDATPATAPSPTEWSESAAVPPAAANDSSAILPLDVATAQGPEASTTIAPSAAWGDVGAESAGSPWEAHQTSKPFVDDSLSWTEPFSIPEPLGIGATGDPSTQPNDAEGPTGTVGPANSRETEEGFLLNLGGRFVLDDAEASHMQSTPHSTPMAYDSGDRGAGPLSLLAEAFGFGVPAENSPSPPEPPQWSSEQPAESFAAESPFSYSETAGQPAVTSQDTWSDERSTFDSAPTESSKSGFFASLFGGDSSSPQYGFNSSDHVDYQSEFTVDQGWGGDASHSDSSSSSSGFDAGGSTSDSGGDSGS